jgi:hypothetical protein
LWRRIAMEPVAYMASRTGGRLHCGSCLTGASFAVIYCCLYEAERVNICARCLWTADYSVIEPIMVDWRWEIGVNA